MTADGRDKPTNDIAPFPTRCGCSILSLAGSERGRRQPADQTHRRRADRPAPADPVRQCRAADLCVADEPFRQREGRDRASARPAPSAAALRGPADLQRGRRPRRACGGKAARRHPARAGGSRLSAPAHHHRRRAAAARRARRDRDLDAADDRHRRLAQCIGRRAEIRRPAGARSRRGRLRRHLGAGARHRPGGASREHRKRHGRGAGRRP